jgi:K+ transporter
VPHEKITLPSRVFAPKYERHESTSALRVSAHFGFMQRPDIPRLLEQAQGRGCSVKLDDVT